MKDPHVNVPKSAEGGWGVMSYTASNSHPNIFFYIQNKKRQRHFSVQEYISITTLYHPDLTHLYAQH